MQQSTNTTAIASLVLGIVALVTLITAGVWWGCLPLPLILGALAWVLGKNAISYIDAGLGNPNERGMATAGYIIGVVTVILSVLGLCCAIGVVGGIVGLSAYPFWDALQNSPWRP
ncbi:MAG: hypothetical protein NZ556_05265 [Fimbriimonadales bacterium]|nr:hypothetical protein [Fimbriimonadales bacterium]